MIDFPKRHIVLYESSSYRIKFFYTGVQKWIWLIFGALLFSGPAILIFAAIGVLADMQVESLGRERIGREQLISCYVRMAYGFIALSHPPTPEDEYRIMRLLAQEFGADSIEMQVPDRKRAVPPTEVEALTRALKGAIGMQEAENLLKFLVSAAGPMALNTRMEFLLIHLADIFEIEVPDYDKKSEPASWTEERNYRVLGIASTASNEEVLFAFRKMAKLHHPDKFAASGSKKQEEAKKKFQEIMEAYESIKIQRGLN